MSEEPLQMMLKTAVEQLRGATDLTIDEVIGLRILQLEGLRTLPDSALTPEVCYSLGVIEGAAAALRATPREMLTDHALLTAPKRSEA